MLHDGSSTGFALACPQQPHISPFLFAEELLCGVLLYWPHCAQPVSVLLCGPSGNGKSHVVCRALQRARGATRRRVLAVTPQLAVSFSRRHADGSTALRRDICRAIRGAVACPDNHRPPDDEEDDAAVVVVLDHMELFLTAANDAAGRAQGGGLARDRSSSTLPRHPVPLAELYDILRGRELFAPDELRQMRLSTVLFVTLFGGALDDVDPFARSKFFDACVSLRTPSEKERIAFFSTHTAYPPMLCRALAARSGGIPYRGLTEIIEHMEEIMQDATLADAEGIPPMSSKEAADGTSCEAAALAALASLRAVQAFATSGSIAAQEYRQSAGYVDVQETRWYDISGLDAVKATLQRLVLRPLKSAATYRRFGARPSTGLLLYGPPGTGKTMLARAMATELNASFIYIDLPQLIQAEVGESERRLREFFDAARERSPSVMFIDELQAAFGARRGPQGSLGSTHDARLVTQLLHLLDKAQEDTEHFTLFVGATNVREMLDTALLRAGRLDTLVEVPPPDAAARRSLVQRAVYGEWGTWFPADAVATQRALVSAFTDGTAGFSGAAVRHALNVFALQFIRFASLTASGSDADFVRQLQELMTHGERRGMSSHAAESLARALTAAAQR
ncbi:putative ATPase [Trypanosoma rangeli]|uniref:Putative ATPase n=1 Tax=Trypanosoma rangeli TaxID=5698 RepID=A0A422MTD5_TRYRA|nr:putative ATPase [Trypanosoma rangeli]RNE96472.1 putative ATPase [Trypanosoma rangeli]|eukprot:RNE96472.1 putative ATPase [Trypanosoma rangeli]